MSTQTQTYFVIVNDNPPKDVKDKERIVIAGMLNNPQHSAIFDVDKRKEAERELRNLRVEHDNPNLVLCKMELTHIEVE